MKSRFGCNVKGVLCHLKAILLDHRLPTMFNIYCG